MTTSNFDKHPKVVIHGRSCIAGWNNIAKVISNTITDEKKQVIAIDCYQGVYQSEIIDELNKAISGIRWVAAENALLPKDEIEDLVKDFVTDDPVFGLMNDLQLRQFFSEEKIGELQQEIDNAKESAVIVIGSGAALIKNDPDLLIYADMPRREIELRFRADQAGNLGTDNFSASYSYQYKRSFFVDWRVLDRHKRSLMSSWDFILDTTIADDPKMVSAADYGAALEHTATRPFRLVPYFDPGPWGGHWMEEKFDLKPEAENLAWSFDGVPEENTLVLSFDGIDFQTPAVNLVFDQPEKLLGKEVYASFGAEFPIRFDLLDTMGGGNLSLQVHPLKEYILEQFNMPYTQDESYYILDAGEDAQVFLGFREDIDPERMIAELEEAHTNGTMFDAAAHVQQFPVKKHDHYIIPSGTIHCSQTDTMVLEISATPYIFTFKLWDWGRMDLDGKPRPISLEHGKQNLQWDRRKSWTKRNLINRFEQLEKGDGWCEQRTGLNPEQFIETRRIKFTKTAVVSTFGSVNVLNLVEGECAVIESPHGAFEPFEVHYAETFIIPAAAGEYSIRPGRNEEGKENMVIRAFVRTEVLEEFFAYKKSRLQ